MCVCLSICIRQTLCVCSEVCLCYYSYMPQMVISKEEEVDHHSCGIHVQRQIIISYLHTHTQSHTRHPIILRHITHEWVILWAYENCINTVPWSSICTWVCVCVCSYWIPGVWSTHKCVINCVCNHGVCVCVSNGVLVVMLYVHFVSWYAILICNAVI